MEWRKEKQIDQVLRYKIDPSIEQNFPVFVCGYGKDGYPGENNFIAMDECKREVILYP